MTDMLKNLKHFWPRSFKTFVCHCGGFTVILPVLCERRQLQERAEVEE